MRGSGGEEVIERNERDTVWARREKESRRAVWDEK